VSVVALRPDAAEVAKPDGRIVSAARVRGMGIFLLLLALLMIGPLGFSVHDHVEATLLLNALPAFHVAPLVTPVRWTGVVLGIVCAGLGTTLCIRTRGRGTSC
jgi:hypothetical protein